MRQEQIHEAIRILKQDVRQWQEPVVGVIARTSARDPFRILISCLLSLRTKDKTTSEASARLFALAYTPGGLLNLPRRTIERAIYPVGFYRTKAKAIHAICRRLLEVYGGTVPDSIDELVTLPGVGRKTANLVVTVGYNKPGICVDIHVHRISNRMGWVQTASPDKTELALYDATDARWWPLINLYLVTWGQNVCRPVYPRCSECAIVSDCRRVNVERVGKPRG